MKLYSKLAALVLTVLLCFGVAAFPMVAMSDTSGNSISDNSISGNTVPAAKPVTNYIGMYEAGGTRLYKGQTFTAFCGIKAPEGYSVSKVEFIFDAAGSELRLAAASTGSYYRSGEGSEMYPGYRASYAITDSSPNGTYTFKTIEVTLSDGSVSPFYLGSGFNCYVIVDTSISAETEVQAADVTPQKADPVSVAEKVFGEESQKGDEYTLTIKEEKKSGSETGADQIKTIAEGQDAVLTGDSWLDLKVVIERRREGQTVTKDVTDQISGDDLLLYVTVPQSLRGPAGRTYFLYRFHSGKAELVASSTYTSIPVSDPKFSLYAIGYSDKAAAAPAAGAAAAVKEDKPVHVHNMHWEVTTPATDSTDGEQCYICTVCGHVEYVVPITAYSQANINAQQLVQKAANGAAVVLDMTPGSFISFHRSVYDAIEARPDLTVTIRFKNTDKTVWTITLPAGEKSFGDLYMGTDFIGFLKLATVYPAVQEQ